MSDTVVPQTTATTAISHPHGSINPTALSGPASACPVTESLTQALFRLPIASSVSHSPHSPLPSFLISKATTRATAKSHISYPSEVTYRPAPLAQTIGLPNPTSFPIRDLAPHQFWPHILSLSNAKEHVVLITGDLIRDRIRNKSLPLYFHSYP